MLENFIKTLGFLGEDATNTNHVADPKNLYKFEDERNDKLWRCHFAFYKKGKIDALNEVSVFCIKQLGEK